jgi:hypothetical protein
MALVIADRVLESTTTTGTGALALGGAHTGYIAFDDVCANGDTCYYAIVAVDDNGNPSGAWETGLGTFSDTDTLTRTTPAASSNSCAAVEFAAGTKHVMLDATAGYLASITRDPEATAAQYRANTADKSLTTDKVWSAADYVALNDSGGNIAVDLSTGINFTMTMDGDYTLSAPSNGKPGQTGCIVLTQDGTGTQTLAYASAWKFAGGTDPTLSTAASSVDILFYQVLANGTDVYATLVKAVA